MLVYLCSWWGVSSSESHHIRIWVSFIFEFCFPNLFCLLLWLVLQLQICSHGEDDSSVVVLGISSFSRLNLFLVLVALSTFFVFFWSHVSFQFFSVPEERILLPLLFLFANLFWHWLQYPSLFYLCSLSLFRFYFFFLIELCSCCICFPFSIPRVSFVCRCHIFLLSFYSWHSVLSPYLLENLLDTRSEESFRVFGKRRQLTLTAGLKDGRNLSHFLEWTTCKKYLQEWR